MLNLSIGDCKFVFVCQPDSNECVFKIWNLNLFLLRLFFYVSCFVQTFFPPHSNGIQSKTILLQFINVLMYYILQWFVFFFFTVVPTCSVHTFHAVEAVVFFMRLNCKRCAKNMRFGPARENQLLKREQKVL